MTPMPDSSVSQSATSRDCEHGRLARSCEICELEAERDRYRTALEWIAGHKLVKGTYADEDHPYDEWLTADGYEMDFGEVHKHAKEALDA